MPSAVESRVQFKVRARAKSQNVVRKRPPLNVGAEKGRVHPQPNTLRRAPKLLRQNPVPTKVGLARMATAQNLRALRLRKADQALDVDARNSAPLPNLAQALPRKARRPRPLLSRARAMHHSRRVRATNHKSRKPRKEDRRVVATIAGRNRSRIHSRSSHAKHILHHHPYLLCQRRTTYWTRLYYPG